MPRWSPDQLNAYEARCRAHDHPRFEGTPCDDESELQERIKEECQRRGWIANVQRMDRRTTGVLGQPDFIIWTHDGGHFMFECKAGKKKRTPEQVGYAAWCERLGHKVWLIRSFSEFINIIDAK